MTLDTTQVALESILSGRVPRRSIRRGPSNARGTGQHHCSIYSSGCAVQANIGPKYGVHGAEYTWTNRRRELVLEQRL